MAEDEPAALLLTGLVGAGKTSLAVEIGELLREDGITHAVFELDWLSWCAPPGDESGALRRLLLENLGFVVANFRAAGIHRFVLAGSIVIPEHYSAIAATLKCIPLKVVHVRGPPEVLLSRVEQRDATRQTLVSAPEAADFLATTRRAVADAFEIDNATPDLASTARLILQEYGWSGLGSG